MSVNLFYQQRLVIAMKLVNQTKKNSCSSTTNIQSSEAEKGVNFLFGEILLFCGFMHKNSSDDLNELLRKYQK